MTERKSNSEKKPTTWTNVILTMTLEMMQIYEPAPKFDMGKVDALAVAHIQIKFLESMLINPSAKASDLFKKIDVWEAAIKDVEKDNWETMRDTIEDMSRKMLEDDSGEEMMKKIGQAYHNLALSI